MIERCVFDDHFGGYECERYMLPFEKELGLHPAQDELHNMVVYCDRGCNRPYIKNVWKNHAGKHWSKYCRTIEECWDYDADARLSAGCIEKRLKEMFSALEAESDNNLKKITPRVVLDSLTREEEALLVARTQEIARQIRELQGVSKGDENWGLAIQPQRPLL